LRPNFPSRKKIADDQIAQPALAIRPKPKRAMIWIAVMIGIPLARRSEIGVAPVN
jgi:hypothetical protein